ncbi:MAG: VOC family protein [Fimbriimonadaceae bacterium]
MKPDFIISRDVALGVKNLEEAKTFYTQILGFTIKSENPDWTQLESKDGAISFYLCQDEVQIPAFCLTVPDVERATEYLVESGCELDSDLTAQTGEVFVRDPNGYLFNIYPRK